MSGACVERSVYISVSKKALKTAFMGGSEGELVCRWSRHSPPSSPHFIRMAKVMPRPRPRQGKVYCSWRAFLPAVVCIMVAMYSWRCLYPQQDACMQTKFAQLPLTELQVKLKMNLVGQDVAKRTIVSQLSLFSTSKSTQPLVLWFSGLEGTGKTLTLMLMQSVLGKACRVQTVLPSLLPQTQQELQDKAASVTRGIDPCATNFLILDGWDETSLPVLTFLRFFLKALRENEGLGNSRVVVILSGTRAGQEVGRYFLGAENGVGGDLTDFSALLKERHDLEQVSPIAVLVPFLPLDAMQVKRCVTRELLVMGMWDVLMDEARVTSLQHQVLSNVKLLPGAHLPFAAHGCKRVASFLTMILPDLGYEP